MSSKLPILLAIAGVAYFISTASAETGDIEGCMDSSACNYDSTATVDDDSCKYGDACDDDDDPFIPIPDDLCDNLNTTVTSHRSIFPTVSNYVYGGSSQNKCKISDIRVSQEDFNIADPVRTMRIWFDAEVYNQSKKRCGEGGWTGIDKKCWFAPTDGTNVGGGEACATNCLGFKISIYPTGSPSPPQDNSGWKSGELIFDKYSNEDEINYGSVEGCGDNCILNLRQLEEARAEYSVTLQLPSTAPLGKYTIKVESKIMGDTSTSGHKFRAIATSTDAFTVAECVVTSEAENYETRFMSNQSFMTL